MYKNYVQSRDGEVGTGLDSMALLDKIDKYRKRQSGRLQVGMALSRVQSSVR